MDEDQLEEKRRQLRAFNERVNDDKIDRFRRAFKRASDWFNFERELSARFHDWQIESNFERPGWLSAADEQRLQDNLKLLGFFESVNKDASHDPSVALEAALRFEDLVDDIEEAFNEWTSARRYTMLSRSGLQLVASLRPPEDFDLKFFSENDADLIQQPFSPMPFREFMRQRHACSECPSVVALMRDWANERLLEYHVIHEQLTSPEKKEVGGAAETTVALDHPKVESTFQGLSILWGVLVWVFLFWLIFGGGWDARMRLAAQVYEVEKAKCADLQEQSLRDCIREAHSKASGYFLFHPMEWFEASQKSADNL